MMKKLKIFFTLIIAIFVTHVVCAQNDQSERFKISNHTIEFLEGDLANYLSEIAYEILQDRLLGTVSDLEAGDNFKVSNDEWNSTLEALKNIDASMFQGDYIHKVQQARDAAQLAAISSRHGDMDKMGNQRFLIRLSELLNDWINE